MKNKIFILCLFIIGFVKFNIAQPPPCGCMPPPPPDYNVMLAVSPLDSAILNDQYPVFMWKDSTSNMGMLKNYQLWINGALAKDSISISDTSFTMTTPLPAGAYTWFVAVFDTLGNSVANTPVRNFFIDYQAPTDFSLISPANGGVSSDCVTEFTWHASKGLITKYKFSISGLPSVTVAPTDTVLIYEFDIPDGPYQWFVTAYDMAGYTTVSDTFSFTKNGKVNTIWGYVQYDNNFNTKLSDVNLSLLNSAGNVVAYTTSDNAGYYKFEDVGNGSYSITADTKKPAGGIDPTDALLINRNYIKLYQFGDDLKKTASDVNADQKTNPIDALQVNRYYIKLIPDFKAGKWLFSDGSFIVNCDGMLQINVRALCIGDVNGSYKPVK